MITEPELRQLIEQNKPEFRALLDEAYDLDDKEHETNPRNIVETGKLITRFGNTTPGYWCVLFTPTEDGSGYTYAAMLGKQGWDEYYRIYNQNFPLGYFHTHPSWAIDASQGDTERMAQWHMDYFLVGYRQDYQSLGRTYGVHAYYQTDEGLKSFQVQI